MYSALIAFFLTFCLLAILSKFHFSAPVKEELVEHSVKRGTPICGSIAFVTAFVATVIYFRSNYIDYIFMLSVFLFFIVGFLDDLMKVMRKNSDGFSSLTKLLLQLIVSILIAVFIRKAGFYKEINVVLYYIFASLYLTVFVNAANISDGLDGLLSKTAIPPLILIGVLLGFSGNSGFIMAAILIAFLFYNSNPASIFMGDGGSHIVGAVLGVGGLISGHPLILILSSLMLFVGFITSFLQIVSIRYFHYHLFSIAPYHHALQKRGWKESKITDCYFVFSALFSLIAYLIASGSNVWV